MKVRKDIYKFLEEYEKLCQKYKMGFRGCGCCGSPYLEYKSGNKDKYIDNIEYYKKDGLVVIRIDNAIYDEKGNYIDKVPFREYLSTERR